SQSGNFVSSFMNYALQTGVGISRAVSAGNAAAVGVADYLGFYAEDPATAAAEKPVVLVKGGATEGGQRAAASHTGALASDDRLFDGVCRQAGATRAATVEEAFDAA